MIKTLALMAFGWFLADVAPLNTPHFWIICGCMFVALLAED